VASILDESGGGLFYESGGPVLDESGGGFSSGRVHGRSGVAYLSLTAGAAAAPVAFLAGWDIGFTADAIDTTVATDIQHLYTAGVPSSAGSFDGFYDTATAQTYASAVDGQPRTLYLYPSSTNPYQFFSGLVLPDYSLSGSVTDAVKLSVSWSSAGLVSGTGL
jgi:hypothetical protein